MIAERSRLPGSQNVPSGIADRMRSNATMLDLVERNMLNTSLLSWEYGTAAQAMLEYRYGSLGIYGSASIPLPAGTARAPAQTFAQCLIRQRQPP